MTPRQKVAIVIALVIVLGAAVLATILRSEPYRLAVAAAQSGAVAKQLGTIRFHVVVRAPIFIREGEDAVVRLRVFGEYGIGTVKVTVAKLNGRYVVTKEELDDATIN